MISFSREKFRSLSLFTASALMLTIIQVPHNAHFLAWISLVPFIIAADPDRKRLPLIVLSFVVSSAYWLCNLWWIGLVTVPGYIAFCVYLGLYWPILVIGVRYFRAKSIPLFLAVPLLFLGAEAWQGILITGFKWRLLAHSQYANTTIIQIADIFGATGVSLIIAMVNGLVAGLIIGWRGKKLLSKTNVFATAIVGCILIATVFYGRYRIGQTDECTEAGPIAGSVQPNIPSYIKELASNGEMILEDLIEKSDKCFAAGAEFTAWPETIVLATMNEDYVRLLTANRPVNIPNKFDKLISEHVKDKGYVLFGGHAAELSIPEYIITDRYNSAFLYRPDGKQDPARFDKMHLVPFGEFIPLRESVPFIYRLFKYFSPYDYDYSLTAGTEFTVFNIKTDVSDYSFGCLICYEDTNPGITKKMVVEKNDNKKVDWLVNISNDGWYVKFNKDTGEVIPSGELSQRTAISVFRAVENRISILRSVNTGVSCIIDPVGKIRDGFIDGDLPVKAMDRVGVEGWFVDRIKIDKRVTFFSKHAQWLDLFFSAGFVCVIIIISMESLLKGRGTKRKES